MKKLGTNVLKSLKDKTDKTNKNIEDIKKNNQKVEELLDELNRDIINCENEHDLKNILTSYNEELQLDYNNKPALIAKLITGVLLIITLVSLSSSLKVFSWIFGILTIGIFIYSIILTKKDDKKDKLIDLLTIKIQEFKYALKFNTINHEYNSIGRLKDSFPELFTRGNHVNTISVFASGEALISNEVRLPFTIYRYDYVDKIVTKRTDNDGKTHTQITYKNYSLFGIFILNVDFMGISISKKRSFYPIKWDVSSLSFRKYHLSGINELELAKFFTPRRVLQLEKMFTGIDTMTVLLHPESSLLVWEFNDDIFQLKNIPQKIQSITNLQELVKNLEMPVFEYIKGHSTIFMEQIK